MTHVIFVDDYGLAADIIFALQIHNTVGIDAMRKEVIASSAMLRRLLAIVEHKSEKEKAWEQSLTALGGRDRVLESDDLITKMANEIEGRTPPKDDRRDAKAGNKTPGDNKEGQVLSLKERLEIQKPLQATLQANLQLYEGKLAVQVQRITDQVKASAQKILDRLDAGSYEKIRNPEVKEVWKDMVRCIRCESLSNFVTFFEGMALQR